MDYLRTLGSAAVSSLVQKSGLNLPFTLGAKVPVTDRTLWTLYEGTKRDDGTPVSIFEYDCNDASRRNAFPLAKNALRKLRTVRHPDVLKFMDAVETDTTIHIMTERVRPLPNTLKDWSSKGAKEKEEWLIWGLHRISVALAFVNDSCASTHGNLRPSSLFISRSGEWKLGGFELLSTVKDEAAVLYNLGSLVPDANMYASPEVKKGGWSVLKEHNPAVADAYAFGLLLHSVFNHGMALPPTVDPPHPPPQPSSRGAIPTALFPSFKRLVNPSPKARMTVKHFLDLGMAQTAGEGAGFFVNNHLVQICAGLDNFNLAGEAEKSAHLKALRESAASFPPEFASYRVLPALVSALEFGGASAAVILPLVLQLGKNMAPEDYATATLAPIIKLYASPDRGTRMALLDHLPEYADKLDKKTVTDKVWPHLQTGFADTVPVIREATVRSIITLSPKFSDRILNNDLLRHLAKMQTDPEPSIRTNTCILLGRLGPSLGHNTKRKVLVPAFSRALKDTFVHARVAALMAFMATLECFDIEDVAGKVVPNISCAMVDKEKLVRDQAFKAVALFVKALEQHAATMPDTVLTEDGRIPGGINAPSAAPGQGTLATSAAGAAGALAGWAITSISKRMAAGDMQTAAGTALERPTSAPPPSDTLRPGTLAYTPSALSAASSPAPGRSGFGRGMQLGASKVPAHAHALASKLADEVAAAEEADGDSGANPWGTDDLIDINADQDDWSAFESAPTQPVASGAASPEPTPWAASHSVLNGSATAKPTIVPDDDPWGGLDDNPTPTQPMSSLSTQPRKPALVPARTLSTTSSSSRRSTPVSSPPPPDSDGWETSTPEPKAAASPVPSMAGMSKEEKAAEMAKRKEERRQRIAQLKEQKKNAGTKS